MRIGFYNFYKVYNNNRMFTDPKGPIGDDLLYPMVRLAEYFRERGHEVCTIDTAPLDTFAAVVFLDYPTILNPYFRSLRRMRHPNLYLYPLEPPVVRPDNWSPRNHLKFKKVFTWSPQFAAQHPDRYVKVFWSVKLRVPERPFTSTGRKGFCTMIAGHKRAFGKSEFYTERIRAIQWFEKHHPDDFDLYGTNWDRFLFPGSLSIFNLGLNFMYNRCPWMPRAKTFPSYKGRVESKYLTLKQYKFAICYENAQVLGWTTEKIFDCLFAGCVPVYLGDPDLEKYVPPSCWIDKRKFPTYEELYKYLKNMTQKEYEEYLMAIYDFLRSPTVRVFSADSFAEILYREIVGNVPN